MKLKLEPPAGISLRPARRGDRDFAGKLYFESTVPLLRALGACSKAAVTERFSKAYRSHPSQVIHASGADVGWLQVSRSEASLHLHQVHLLDGYRNRGIGTGLIRKLMEQAQAMGLPLTLNVVRGNPAIALYLRLGFRVVDEDAELLRMRWDAPGPAEP